MRSAVLTGVFALLSTSAIAQQNLQAMSFGNPIGIDAARKVVAAAEAEAPVSFAASEHTSSLGRADGWRAPHTGVFLLIGSGPIRSDNRRGEARQRIRFEGVRAELV